MGIIKKQMKALIVLAQPRGFLPSFVERALRNLEEMQTSFPRVGKKVSADCLMARIFPSQLQIGSIL